MVEIIVKLPDEDYDRIKDIPDAFDSLTSRVYKSIKNGTPLPKCKDCKHFEYDHIENVLGIPLIVAHEICNRWGEGCKTSEDGYCFLFEADKEVENED